MDMKSNMKTDMNKVSTKSVEKNVELLSHFVYDNDKQQIVGNVYLTEEQAYQLNKIMRVNGTKDQRFAFLQT